MPSEIKTPHLGLNQWQGNEYPKREDFNQDNALIDAALAGHVGDTIAHMTQAQKDQLAAAVQSATVGGSAVTKSGTALQLPAYPTALKSPAALTFTGGVTGSYDGSAAKTVAIPTTLPANGGTAANTTSVAGSLTVSTAAPSSYIGDGKMWGVY